MHHKKKLKRPALRGDQLKIVELPEAIFIEFDDETIGSREKYLEGLVSITPTSATYQNNKSLWRRGKTNA